MRRIDTPTAAEDLFGPGKDGFRDGNPALAILATRLNAAFFNAMQEEIAGVVEGAGLALNPADNTQLFQAIQLLGGKVLTKSVAGGVSVTLSAAENRNPVILLTGALTANINVIVPAIGRQWVFANNTTGAFTVTVKTAAGTGVGILQGLSQHLYCDGANVLQVGSPSAQKQLQTLSASVGANALTVGLAASTLDFRAASLSSGAINSRAFSALSLVVPSGATLGTASGVAARLVLLAIDNGGTVELAAVNLAGGVNLDETTLINTAAINSGATAANVVYSATARTGVPFRVVGFYDSLQATAGAWVTAPTIQGAGGQALAALSSFGYGQTWQNVAGSRALGTTYTNTTGRPILVSTAVLAASGITTTAVVNGVSMQGSTSPNPSQNSFITFIVPPGGTYSITGAGTTPSITTWTELR